MTSTSEIVLCGCGCGKVILPTDDHPWFKLRSCQQVWTATKDMSEAERTQWCWDQRFYFTTLHSVTWGDVIDWDYQYTDQMMIMYANSRLEEARCALVPFDIDDMDNLADALRILTHWDYMCRYSDKWLGEDKLPNWAFRERRNYQVSARIEDTLKKYGLA